MSMVDTDESSVDVDELSDLDGLISLVDEELAIVKQQYYGLVPWEHRRMLLFNVREDLVYEQVRAIEKRIPDVTRGGVVV